MKIYNLPDISQESQVDASYIINNTTYDISFYNREDLILIDIYKKHNGENLTLVKGLPVVKDINLIDRIKNPELITGSLYITNKSGSDSEMYSMNFSDDFELVYYSEEENH